MPDLSKLWTDSEIQVLRKNYGKKKIKEWIHLLPNRNHKTICHKAFRLGIKADRSLSTRKYSYNRQYFSKPNIENCYWAGFISGDGCVSRVTINNKLYWTLAIQLCTKDKNILEYFQEDIDYTGLIFDKIIINNYKDKGRLLKDKYYSSVLRINSAKPIIDDLNKYWNITPRKSLTLQPPNINGDLSLSYIVGYIDADGCIGLYNKKYAGKYAQLICEHLLTIKTPFKLSRKWNKIYDSKFCTI